MIDIYQQKEIPYIQIALPEHKDGIISFCEEKLESFNVESLDDIHSETPPNVYESARRSYHKDNVGDLLLFARYPHISHLFRSILALETNVDMRSGPSFINNCQNVRYFLQRNGLIEEGDIDHNVIPFARLVSANSMASRMLVNDDIFDVITREFIRKPTETETPPLSVRFELLEEGMGLDPNLSPKLLEILSKINQLPLPTYLSLRRDLLGMRILYNDPKLLDESLRRIASLKQYQPQIRYRVAKSNSEGWTDMVNDQVGSKEVSRGVSRKMLSELVSTKHNCLPYVAIHCTILDNGRMKEIQMRLNDPDGNLIKLDIATSLAMRKGGFSKSGITSDTVEMLRVGAILTAEKMIHKRLGGVVETN